MQSENLSRLHEFPSKIRIPDFKHFDACTFGN